jgi:hypothetical protein
MLYGDATCWQQGWPVFPQATHDGTLAPGGFMQAVPLAPQ